MNDFVSGYSVTSTAPLNVEEEIPDSEAIWKIKSLKDDSQEEINIQNIAKQLCSNGQESELVIGVHGYAQGKDAPFWYQGIFDYFSDKDGLEKNKNYVFLGYLWPSEKPPLLLKSNFVSMPGTILGTFLFLGFFILSFCIIILLVSEQKKISEVINITGLDCLGVFVVLYIGVACFLLSHRHKHNNSRIEWWIDIALWVLSGALLFFFLHILHSQYDSFVQPLLFAISVLLLIVIVRITLSYINALELLEPTLTVCLCIVIAVQFLLIQPFTPIVQFFRPIVQILLFLLDRLGNSFIIAIPTFVLGIITALILLRSVAYFRDSYRANHFGVPDLVELIRQLDRAIFLEKYISNLEVNLEVNSKELKYKGQNLNVKEEVIKDLFSEIGLREHPTFYLVSKD